jgi:type IV pilus assembly protein PilC
MLSEAFRRQQNVFPELLINMVAAGEESGTLDTVMDRMATFFEKENATRNKIKSAMIYPIILLIVTIVVVIGLITFVMPQFVNLLTEAGATLPLPTRILMGISNGIVDYWYLIIIVIMIAGFGFYSWKKSRKGRLTWDSFKLTMPIMGNTITAITCARFSRNMATLLSSGIQLIQCIEITSRVLGNQYFADHIMASKEDIRRGQQLSDALRKITKLPPMIHNMVGIGEESGALDSILNKTADFYDEEADTAIKRLVAMLEPIMILVMGVLVGFIIVSIMMPMFQLYGNIT